MRNVKAEAVCSNKFEDLIAQYARLPDNTSPQALSEMCELLRYNFELIYARLGQPARVNHVDEEFICGLLKDVCVLYQHPKSIASRIVMGFEDRCTPLATDSEHKKIVRQLPTILAMGVVLLDRRSRAEVASDLEDWYQEIAETRGTRWAKIFVFMKLANALGCQVLSFAERIAGIIGIARGQKKTE